jgi:hypothetical protein
LSSRDRLDNIELLALCDFSSAARFAGSIFGVDILEAALGAPLGLARTAILTNVDEPPTLCI